MQGVRLCPRGGLVCMSVVGNLSASLPCHVARYVVGNALHCDRACAGEVGADRASYSPSYLGQEGPCCGRWLGSTVPDMHRHHCLLSISHRYPPDSAGPTTTNTRKSLHMFARHSSITSGISHKSVHPDTPQPTKLEIPHHPSPAPTTYTHRLSKPSSNELTTQIPLPTKWARNVAPFHAARWRGPVLEREQTPSSAWHIPLVVTGLSSHVMAEGSQRHRTYERSEQRSEP